MKLSRLRTFTLWTGTTLCVLIVAAFVVSGWWYVVLQVPTHGPCMLLHNGSIGVVMRPPAIDVVYVAWRIGHWDFRSWNEWSVAPRQFGFPLYAVFLAVAVPTLLVWRFGRKPVKPGHCRCGYNLTRNQSGKCPECGVEVQA